MNILLTERVQVYSCTRHMQHKVHENYMSCACSFSPEIYLSLIKPCHGNTCIIGHEVALMFWLWVRKIYQKMSSRPVYQCRNHMIAAWEEHLPQVYHIPETPGAFKREMMPLDLYYHNITNGFIIPCYIDRGHAVLYKYGILDMVIQTLHSSAVI